MKKRTAGGHSFPSSLLCHVTFLTNTYISNTHTIRCAESRYFSKVAWLHRDDITSSWGGVSPSRLSQELYLSNSVTIEPLEVKIISILLYKNNNCPMLFCTFTIDKSSFLTTVTQKMFCVSLFSVKKVSDI